MIRENRKTMPLKEAIRKAVEDCIKQNILREFLLKHKEEVIGMLLTDWDLDTALDVSKEEGFEMGWDKGMEKGKGEGMEIAAEKIARAMKEKGADVNFIAEVTNLPIDTIQRL
jgi:predicted transposase YdaD